MLTDELFTSLVRGQPYVTVQSYTAKDEDELSLPVGVNVEVTDKSMMGWWKVKYVNWSCILYTYLEPVMDLYIAELGWVVSVQVHYHIIVRYKKRAGFVPAVILNSQELVTSEQENSISPTHVSPIDITISTSYTMCTGPQSFFIWY